MKIRQTLFVLFLTYLLSSCVATHNGTVSTSSIGKPIQYVDIAIGVSQVNRYFGFGGISQDALILEAKRDMMKNRLLNPNEEYVNYTIDFKRTYFPFYNQVKITMSADVVKFTNDVLTDVYSDNYKRKMLERFPVNELFEVGDSIINDRNLSGTILSFETSNKVRILYKTNKNKIRTKILSTNDIFTNKKEYKGIKIGRRYIYNTTEKGNVQQTSGKIRAFGLHRIIIQENNGNIITIDYNDVN